MEDFRKPELHKAALAELVGTFFLTLAALISGSPFVVGLTLAAFVYTIGDVSGCNINPAVTVALVTARRLSLMKGVYYIVVQVIGALLARLVAGLVGTLAPQYVAGNIFAEFFGVAFLIVVVMSASANYIPKSGSGIAIGAALAAGLVTSKGILNPAVAIAMGQGLTQGVWAPLLAGVVFALLSQLYLTKKDASQASAIDEQGELPLPPRLVVRSGLGETQK